MTDWGPLVSVVLAVIVMLFGFAKWFMDWVEKRDEQQGQVFDKQLEMQKKRLDDRLDDHKSEFDSVHKRIDKHVEELGGTREELLRDYVKHSHFDNEFKKMSDEINNIHQRLGGISSSLNQLIGLVKGKFGND